MKENKEFDPNVVQFGTVIKINVPGDVKVGIGIIPEKHVIIQVISKDNLVTVGIMNSSESSDEWSLSTISGSSSFDYIKEVIGLLSVDEVIKGMQRYADQEEVKLEPETIELIKGYSQNSLSLNFPDELGFKVFRQ